MKKTIRTGIFLCLMAGGIAAALDFVPATEAASQTTMTRTTTRTTTRSTSASVGVGVGRGSGWNHNRYGGGLMLGVGYGGVRQAPGQVRTIDAAGDAAQAEEYAKAGALALVRGKDGWGVLGTNGQELIPTSYKLIEPVGQAAFAVKGKEDKNVHIVNVKGENTELQVSPEQEAVQKTVPYAFRDEKTKRFGFRLADGTVVLPPEYREVLTAFSDDRAAVKNSKGKKVVIDSKGNEIFPVVWDQIFPYANGLAEVQRKASGGLSLGGLIGVVIGNGRGGFGYHDYDDPFYSGVGIWTYDGIKRGYVDREGREIISSKLDAVYPMTPYGTAVKNDGQAGFVRPDGTYVIGLGDYEIGSMDMDEGLLSLQDKKTKKFGVVSVVDGKVKLPYEYDGVIFTGHDRAALKKGDQYELVDLSNGQKLAAINGEARIGFFGPDDYLWVRNGQVISPDTSAPIGSIRTVSKAAAEALKNKWQILNAEGQVTYTDTKNISEVKPFRNGYSAAKANGKWGLIDSKGNWLVEPAYKDIESL